MKQFFRTGTVLMATILVASLVIVFQSQLLSSYDRTRVSVPTELKPVQTQPVPASIRTDHPETSPTEKKTVNQSQDTSWRANSVSDIANAPKKGKKEIKKNIQLPAISQQ